MYMQAQDSFTVNQEQEFSRPVESIMRCEDFKSNFARRLSNRYISRSPSTSSRQDSALKLRPAEPKHTEADPENVPERIEPSSQLSKNGEKEQNYEPSMPDAETATQSAMRHTEVTALHMEVDTLRWQLAQTEANRQMHIALLNQIVTFLNRVKNHIECQKTEFNESNGTVKDISIERIPRSFNAADIPRSRSVVHVNKHLEYSLRPAKKLGTRKISKSISNVNGFKDCNSTWNQSKVSLTSSTDHSLKMTEEISRLITLANTVLSTKLPDLACNDVQINSNDKISVSGDKKESQNLNSCSMDLIEEDAKDATTNSFLLKSICKNTELFEDLPSSLVDAVDDNMKEFTMPLSTLSCEEASEFATLKLSKDQQSHISEDKSKIKNTKSLLTNKKLDYNQYATSKFIEDESGFSSMSSFQEIGIPIISIIPPSPCKEIEYVDNIPEIIEETGNWKTEIELNKQTVKVFWV